MDERENILNMTERSRLTADVTLLMLKGGGYALVFCLTVWLVISVIAVIGRVLPDESRDTPDPINRSSIEMTTPLVQQT